MPYSPSVSVIVPVYKQEKYLGQCLESVANQTFQDWECIVVDDGSDNPGLIDDIASSSVGNRGSVVHQSNKGLATARNIGIANASGRFLVCLDADDYLHLEFLEKTTAVLHNSNEPGVTYCWTRHFGARRDLFIPPSNIRLFWLLQRNLISVTSLFKKEMWADLGGFDESMSKGHEDWEFWIRAGLGGYKFQCIPEPLFYYRISPGSMVENATKQRVDTIHYIRNKHAWIYFMPLRSLFNYPDFREIPKPSLIRFWLSGFFFHYVPAIARRSIFSIYRKLCD